jgi:hypothetical protein
MSSLEIERMPNILEDPSKYYGKKIILVEPKIQEKKGYIELYTLEITFDCGTKIVILDSGQECCEKRYISTDDDVSEMVNQTLKSIKVKNYTTSTDKDDKTHEIVFIEIQGNKSSIILRTHNENYGLLWRL